MGLLLVNLVVLSSVSGLFADMALAAAGYVHPRHPTEEDIAHARLALQALLPAQHGAYSLDEAGNLLPGFGKFVRFSTSLVDNAGLVARATKVTCTDITRPNENPRWRCRGPEAYIVSGGHSFPEPTGIDDKTIRAIVDFVNSRCPYEQIRKHEDEQARNGIRTPRVGPGFPPGRIPIRSLKTRETGYEIFLYSDGLGYTLLIERSDDSDLFCRFRSRLIGTSIAGLRSGSMVDCASLEWPRSIIRGIGSTS